MGGYRERRVGLWPMMKPMAAWPTIVAFIGAWQKKSRQTVAFMARSWARSWARS